MTLDFNDITTEQAVAILSHLRAIAQLTEKNIDAFVKGTARDEQGELVFLVGYRRVGQLPTRKYFGIYVDDAWTRVRFDETFDLSVTLA